mgnify:CR=1 FL=1
MDDNAKEMNSKVMETIKSLKSNGFDVWYAIDKAEAESSGY